jgi:hypothetical protein
MEGLVLHFCIRPVSRALVLLAIMDIRASALILKQALATSRRKIERPGALRRICRRLENCKIIRNWGCSNLPFAIHSCE